MTAKLTKELAAALHATGDHELEVVDPDTLRVYFIVEGEMHRQAATCAKLIWQWSFHFDFGRNATIWEGLVSKRGPPIRSMQ